VTTSCKPEAIWRFWAASRRKRGPAGAKDASAAADRREILRMQTHYFKVQIEQLLD